MANNEKVLDIPGLEIKRLLNLRGINQKQLAEKTGVSYFVLNKFLTQTGYKTYRGQRHLYKVPHIRKAIAEELNIPHDILWGERGRDALNSLIEEEMKSAKVGKYLKKRFALGAGRKKSKWQFRRFVKNLISLGHYCIYTVNDKR